MPVKVDPKNQSNNDKIFEGKFGYEITIGSKVLYTHKHSFFLGEGTVSKVTDKYVWVRTGHGEWCRRKVRKGEVQWQLISMEAINAADNS